MSGKEATAEIGLKRVYEDPAAADGCRVLVDRLWPRGLSKDDASLDHWFKELAPSNELRRWYGHDPEKWDAFRRRYEAELEAEPEALEPLRRLLESERKLTLLFAAKDEKHNNAVALAEFLRGG